MSPPFSPLARRFTLLLAVAGALTSAACGGAPSSPDESASEQSSVTAAAGAKLSFSPGSKSFGSVTVGSTSASTTFTLRNGGTTATQPVTVAVSGTARSEFRIAADDCAGKSLRAGGSCTLAVTFAPTATGTQAATLTASFRGGTTADASLSGTGVGAASLVITPGTFNFGGVAAGTSSPDATFTVTNVGGSSSGTLSAALAGAEASSFVVDADGCAGVALAPEATCTVRVHFAPPGGASGAEAATLDVSATPGGSVAVSLGGSIVSPELVLTPPAGWGGFGDVPIGQSSTATFAVTNEGGAASGPVTIRSTSTDFALSASTCGAALAPGARCTFVVSFRPSTTSAESALLDASAAGAGSATLTVNGVGEL